MEICQSKLHSKIGSLYGNILLIKMFEIVKNLYKFKVTDENNEKEKYVREGMKIAAQAIEIDSENWTANK